MFPADVPHQDVGVFSFVKGLRRMPLRAPFRRLLTGSPDWTHPGQMTKAEVFDGFLEVGILHAVTTPL